MSSSEPGWERAECHEAHSPTGFPSRAPSARPPGTLLKADPHLVTHLQQNYLSTCPAAAGLSMAPSVPHAACLRLNSPPHTHTAKGEQQGPPPRPELGGSHPGRFRRPPAPRASPVTNPADRIRNPHHTCHLVGPPSQEAGPLAPCSPDWAKAPALGSAPAQACLSPRTQHTASQRTHLCTCLTHTLRLCSYAPVQAVASALMLETDGRLDGWTDGQMDG